MFCLCTLVVFDFYEKKNLNFHWKWAKVSFNLVSLSSTSNYFFQNFPQVLIFFAKFLLLYSSKHNMSKIGVRVKTLHWDKNHQGLSNESFHLLFFAFMLISVCLWLVNNDKAFWLLLVFSWLLWLLADYLSCVSLEILLFFSLVPLQHSFCYLHTGQAPKDHLVITDIWEIWWKEDTASRMSMF